MTSSEIRGNIRYNENLINQFTNEKRTLEEQINELESLRNKFAVLQNDFENRQDARKNSILRFSGLSIQNTIFKSYISGMKELITGNAFSVTDAGLNEARGIINSQIQNVLNRIEECENNISYRMSRKSYWQWQLQIVLEQEAAAAALVTASDNSN